MATDRGPMGLETLDRNTTLITVNRRLARVLRADFDRARLAAGERVWESPDILPYGSWLQRSWNDVVAAADGDLPALLSTEQDSSLWERVIAERPAAGAEPALLQSAEAARNAQAAWALLRAWRLAHDGDLGPASDEVRAFQGWARDYAQRCRESRWLDPASVADRLLEHVRRGLPAGALLAPAPHTREQGARRRLLLAGFDALTPQQEALFQALAEAGMRVEHRRGPAHEVNALRVDFATPDAELEGAAQWARRRLEEESHASIGIVVPELERVRPRVAALFADVFAPGAARPGAPPPAPLVNISLGEALAAIPVVGDALLGLRAMEGTLSLADAGRWLLSPYLGGGALGARACLDAELRRIGEPGYSLARLADLGARARPAGELQPAAADAMAGLFQRLASRAPAPGRRLAVSAWAAQFSSWLASCGWPGERTLNSDEYQAVQAFHDLVATLAALAPVLPPVDLGAALAQLQRLAARQLFQPRSGSAPVQVLGVLEALGSEFSHLWISGMHHQAWPPSARPNPFLPGRLQRSLGMPRAGSEQQLAWARGWTSRMLASAPQVVVSHPRQQGDEPLRVSALFAGLPTAEPDTVIGDRFSADVSTVHAAAPAAELLDDQTAPAVDERLPVRGGVSVFKDQAACPFRAFAIHRLGARDVAAPDSSLDPRVRGNLAHRLLELLWHRLGDHAQLLALSAQARAELVRSTAERVIAHEARRRPHTLRGRLLALEGKRLESLAEAWLDIEAARAPFEVQAERSESCTVAGLPVTLRPDRIDRLADGRLFLIDYKTGPSNPKDWFGERPDEPQLPVYAVAVDELGQAPVAGLAFAMLRTGELGFRGMGADDDLVPGVNGVEKSKLHGAREAPDWDSHKSLWRERLSALARDYLRGDARVDPKVPGATCRYCGLQVLCRIHEQ